MAKKGLIALFAGSFIPKGWALCDGKNGTPKIPNLAAKNYSPNSPIMYVIATEEVENEPVMGFIYPTPMIEAPSGWAFCDGQMLSQNNNMALYSILGISFGHDSKTSSFALPKIEKFKSNDIAGSNNYIRYMICLEGIYPSRD